MRALALVLLLGCGGESASAPAIDPNEGKRGGPCYPNGTCNDNLSCVEGRCAAAVVDSGASETSVDTGTADTGAMIDSATAMDTADTSVPVAYTKTEIAAACDDVMGGDVPGVVAEDGSSMRGALPFAFKYFGEAVTHGSMSSNGFAQLWTGAGAEGDRSADNVALPGGPKGMIAPFWDDLSPVFSNARIATLGSAPNRRHVIAWIHWSTKGDTGTRLTFQIKLFETTNVIELHYCAMAPADNMRAQGASATIGLTNVAGTSAIQHAFNTASAVASGRALRFSP